MPRNAEVIRPHRAEGERPDETKTACTGADD